MTAANFDRALSLVLVHEGGYVNHPADPGGATNKGITQATYNAWRKSRGLATRSVKSITNAEVATIYRNNYWNAIRGDDLPSGVDYMAFDFAVNSGPRRSAQYLQRVVGVDDDGKIGPVTLAAVAKHDAVSVINLVLDRRLAWLKTLTTWKTFGKGWSNRIAGVRKDALAMIGAPAPQPSPVTPVPPSDGTLGDPDPETPPETAVAGWTWTDTGIVAGVIAVVTVIAGKVLGFL